MIGIIAAMNTEAALIRDAMDDITEVKKGSVLFTLGKIHNKDVCITVCGVGKVFAALAAEAMIMAFSPSVIINTGVSGGVGDDVSVLDFVISEKTVQHDMDTSPLGDPVGLISGINKIFFDCDEDAVSLMEISALSVGAVTKRGIIASGDRFVASTEEKNRIKNTFSASAADMESAAIGHVCFVNGVPFVAARCISDSANEDAKIDFPTLCKMAADVSSRVVIKFISLY